LLGKHFLPLAGSQCDCVVSNPLDLAAKGATAGGDPYFGTRGKGLDRIPSRGGGLRGCSCQGESERRGETINLPESEHGRPA